MPTIYFKEWIWKSAKRLTLPSLGGINCEVGRDVTGRWLETWSGYFHFVSGIGGMGNRNLRKREDAVFDENQKNFLYKVNILNKTFHNIFLDF